ncbi:RNA polymerase, sigma 54 subunit, RpoN [Candidatus Vecturithrix granuli]|uniref:RNA polymerase, sigma 54 subunit, RpoN n=1 Tax=Vecturithrix granuli TaxID=1499967 RepID=A0A081BXR1_VECG1|nr:RNA polymerase, sigma 54 subunit, RpoN [Candidatus Vecturithrix granuli]
MNVDARINLNLSQRLVMTPMLQQAIKLLQMSRLELVDLVKQEMLENPVLEELEEGLESQPERQDEQEGYMNTDDSLNDDAWQMPQDNTSVSEPLQEERGRQQQDFPVNWEEYFHDNPSTLGYYGEYEPDEGSPSYDSLLKQPLSLSEHLLWQLQMSQVPERPMKIGRFLIGQIDDNGYLNCDDLQESSIVNRQATSLRSNDLKEYRGALITGLCQKIHAEFERDYMISSLHIPGKEGMLARVLIQEYYEDLISARYEELVRRLQHFSLEELETIAKYLCEIPLVEMEQFTGIPASEITQGFEHIWKICTELQQIIEGHFHLLLGQDYATKLEKLGLSPEEFYLVEYLLLQLSAEEIAYIASRENTTKATKYEKEVEEFLGRLQQSYSHIDQLKSHRYFLVQLYTVGIEFIADKIVTDHGGRLQKLGVKLLHVTEADVAQIAKQVSAQLDGFYQTVQEVSPKEVEHILQHIQTFTPSGVGARDLNECLLIQARNLGLQETPVEAIISDYLEELNQQQYQKIADHLEISVEDVEAMHKIIVNMSPRPGADFSYERPEYIVPDIYVYKVDEEYEVVLNDDDLPNLRINPLYRKYLTGNNHDVPSTTKQYVDQKLRSAMWFIRSVEQRKRTIYKVGKSIVKFQKEFLEHGVSHLKPLVLRDVADDIAMHESTVSRVTTNKYIHTPQGVFELKFFFHSGLESTSGDDVSSIAIKDKIRQMIEEEDPEHPLSDKTIEKKMTAAGVAIARRTIAKYREELDIPSSIQRKRKRTSNGQ